MFFKNIVPVIALFNETFFCHILQCARANPCYEADKCENRVPGYQCAACPDGYRGNAPSGVGLEDAQNSKQACQEIDECTEGISTCDPNAQCINTNVSLPVRPHGELSVVSDLAGEILNCQHFATHPIAILP